MPRTIGQTVREARRSMADAIAGVSQQRRAFTTELREAQSYRNDMLSAEGLRQERDRRTQAVRGRHQQTLDGHAAAVNTAANHLTAALAGRPAADANALARHEQHWRRAQQLLDAGYGVPQVIAHLNDPAALEALRAELPTYLDAKGHQPEPLSLLSVDGAASLFSDHAASLLRIDRRLNEVGADTDAGSYAAARLALGADGAHAQAEVDATAGLLDGKLTLMGASVVSTTAARHAAEHAA